MDDPFTEPHASPRKSRLKRFAIRLAVITAICLICCEFISRYYLGLGDPPLMMSDSKIEYLFQPNQSGHRFGNYFHYNAYSMRSDDFPEHKRSPNELRVLMIGDSVLNGGSLTDQSQLASTILEHELAETLHRPVVVGNISAGSWGPPNELEYVRRFGLFEADVVVIVVSSHDIVDVPTFEPNVGVRPDAPDRKPFSATTELLTRYILPRLHIGNGKIGDLPPPPDDTLPAKDVAECETASREMIRMARSIGATVIVAQHLEKPEAEHAVRPGYALFHQLAEDERVRSVNLGDSFRASLTRGESPYRDLIHPNALGQKLIADRLLPIVAAAAAPPRLTTGATTPPATTTPATTAAAR